MLCSLYRLWNRYIFVCLQIKYLWTKIWNLDEILDEIGDFGRTENDTLDSMFVQSLLIIHLSCRIFRSNITNTHTSHIGNILYNAALYYVLRWQILKNLPMRYLQENPQFLVADKERDSDVTCLHMLLQPVSEAVCPDKECYMLPYRSYPQQQGTSAVAQPLLVVLLVDCNVANTLHRFTEQLLANWNAN